MLGDAAGFARDDLGIADRIQKRCLAVVDMAHDRDDRRAGLQIFIRILDRVDDIFDICVRDPLHLVPEFFDDQFGCVS